MTSSTVYCPKFHFLAKTKAINVAYSALQACFLEWYFCLLFIIMFSLLVRITSLATPFHPRKLDLLMSPSPSGAPPPLFFFLTVNLGISVCCWCAQRGCRSRWNLNNFFTNSCLVPCNGVNYSANIRIPTWLPGYRTESRTQSVIQNPNYSGK